MPLYATPMPFLLDLLGICDTCAVVILDSDSEVFFCSCPVLRCKPSSVPELIITVPRGLSRTISTKYIITSFPKRSYLQYTHGTSTSHTVSSCSPPHNHYCPIIFAHGCVHSWGIQFSVLENQVFGFGELGFWFGGIRFSGFSFQVVGIFNLRKIGLNFK